MQLSYHCDGHSKTLPTCSLALSLCLVQKLRGVGQLIHAALHETRSVTFDLQSCRCRQ